MCIRHLDWSETSQVVVLLTAEHGKLRGLAKGSKRSSPSAIARFSGGIELLTLGQAVGVIKSTSDLAALTEWDLQDPFTHLRRNLAGLRIGLYAADLVNAMLELNDPHPKVFELLQRFLHDLADDGRRQAALLRFQWGLLADCGYRPRLDIDVSSGQALPDQPFYSFDPRDGGFSGQRITDGSTNGAGPWRVRRETVQALRVVDRDEPFHFPDAGALERANRLLCVYARAILDRRLPTMSFILEAEQPT